MSQLGIGGKIQNWILDFYHIKKGYGKVLSERWEYTKVNDTVLYGIQRNNSNIQDDKVIKVAYDRKEASAKNVG